MIVAVAAGMALGAVTSPSGGSSASAAPCAESSSASSLGPVEVVSVVGPIPPYNPGGPDVRITLENAGSDPVISLNATLSFAPETFPGGIPVTYGFGFGATASNPLQPGQSASDSLTLIGAGFSSGETYPLTICGMLATGSGFSYTVQVQIVSPS